jgi:sulfide:quinone oxidoreductase
LDGAFTKAVCNRELSGMLDQKGIQLVTEFNTGEVDAGGRLVSFDGREVGFDLAVTVPVHGGQAYIGRSPGLGDALGFIPADEHTLQAKASPTSSSSATPPTSAPRRQDRSRTSRARSSPATSSASWAASR